MKNDHVLHALVPSSIMKIKLKNLYKISKYKSIKTAMVNDSFKDAMAEITQKSCIALFQLW